MVAEPTRGYEEEAAALYAVSPAQFTAARDARVAELRGEHRAVLAGRLKLLRRPTVAAWCVNLLAAGNAVELRALLDLGAALADAQRRADPAAIRDLSDRRRARVAALIEAAGRAAGTRLDASVVADLEATLNAAVADSEVANRVVSGRLVRGESFAGFGPLPEPARASWPSGGSAGGSAGGVAYGGGSSGGGFSGGGAHGDAGAGARAARAARAASLRADAVAAVARCGRDDARRARDVARHAREEATAVLAEAERRLADAERELAAADRAFERAERDRRQAAEHLDATEQALTTEP